MVFFVILLLHGICCEHTVAKYICSFHGRIERGSLFICTNYNVSSFLYVV